MVSGTGYEAGVDEYWLTDVRGDVPELAIHSRGKGGFEPLVYADDGFVRSAVLGCDFRLTRRWNALQFWDYDLEVH